MPTSPAASTTSGTTRCLTRLPTFTTIRRWLKAGTVDLGTWSPTTAGTPQGGIASPVLANVALDGMERLFGAEDDRGRPVQGQACAVVPTTASVWCAMPMIWW